MAFDIYGNNLRLGHCEVHPQVDEEYPCFVCRMEYVDPSALNEIARRTMRG